MHHITHMKGPCPPPRAQSSPASTTEAVVLAHARMRHITHMNVHCLAHEFARVEQSHTHECIISHLWMIHIHDLAHELARRASTAGAPLLTSPEPKRCALHRDLAGKTSADPAPKKTCACSVSLHTHMHVHAHAHDPEMRILAHLRVQHTVTLCNTLCNTLQYTATHWTHFTCNKDTRTSACQSTAT